jgi:hypothetical protein
VKVAEMVSESVMTPHHPRWFEFLASLNLADRCRHNTDHARAALERMPGIDSERSLAALNELGGTCDCAILFDVAPGDLAGAAAG